MLTFKNYLLEAIRKNKRHNPCCDNPRQEHYSSWKDETGKCASCGKWLRYGNGPGKAGKWPSGSIRGKK